MTDEEARKTLDHYLGSKKCMSCRNNPVAKAVAQKLVSPGINRLEPDRPAMAVLPCEGRDAYEVRVRFFLDGSMIHKGDYGDLKNGVMNGIAEAMKNYSGDGMFRSKLFPKRTPKPQPPMLPNFSGGKRGAP